MNLCKDTIIQNITLKMKEDKIQLISNDLSLEKTDVKSNLLKKQLLYQEVDLIFIMILRFTLVSQILFHLLSTGIRLMARFARPF